MDTDTAVFTRSLRVYSHLALAPSLHYVKVYRYCGLSRLFLSIICKVLQARTKTTFTDAYLFLPLYLTFFSYVCRNAYHAAIQIPSVKLNWRCI
ncbi:hypothetical protein K450DRAFT_249126 [Umbelopsis ramanniana AG]|uniref:Uncharacterized protein n=1 Tax=Umbelopsis ramanniana AG TaxID=1314678 RepID=A0AAD5E7H3_UMBRA|nr:uncharacterized protein K450DRAFT_249126 [Umbelopsis ramanniana AG]KAI8578119.1 hypothetical protein K450DRAFT_249126 [Umbelopsis ramanniana AG]